MATLKPFSSRFLSGNQESELVEAGNIIFPRLNRDDGSRSHPVTTVAFSASAYYDITIGHHFYAWFLPHSSLTLVFSCVTNEKMSRADVSRSWSIGACTALKGFELRFCKRWREELGYFTPQSDCLCGFWTLLEY